MSAELMSTLLALGWIDQSGSSLPSDWLAGPGTGGE